MTDVKDGKTRSKSQHLSDFRDEMAAQNATAREKQEGRGKRSALDRVHALLDEDTFVELDAFVRHRATQFGMGKSRPFGDGVVTGFGKIDGRLVAVFSQDFTIFGGSLGEAYAEKMVKLMDLAEQYGCPIIGINDAAGARIQEGVEGLAGYGDVFFRNVRASGVVPQISIIAGPCAGGAAYSPALTDFIIQTRQAHMFLTGPGVIQQVTGERVTQDELGGADAHMARSGVTHFVADNDEQALLIAKKLLSFLPQNNTEDPPIVHPDDIVEPTPELRDVVPVESRLGYDVRDVIARIVDRRDFLEVQAGFAMNMVIGFARITGRAVGIVANQPQVMSGVLDINSSDKASSFVRFCNAFNIPLVTLVDVPGFLPGVAQEHGGVIRHGAKMLYAYSAATVPKITVVLRKAYGGAYVAMCSKDLGADRVFAWPTAEIAVMGAEGAAGIVFRREIDTADDPDTRRAELVGEYRSTFSTPYMAASRGLVDDIIDPADTRREVAMALEILAGKRAWRPDKKHGLGPT